MCNCVYGCLCEGVDVCVYLYECKWVCVYPGVCVCVSV